jgi:hypothetical protein
MKQTNITTAVVSLEAAGRRNAETRAWRLPRSRSVGMVENSGDEGREMRKEGSAMRIG